MQEKNLYIPWFRESYSKRSPWFILQQKSMSVWMNFERFIIPWDTNNWSDVQFSLSTLEDSIFNYISEIQDRIHIIVFSLSAFPVLKAISKLLDENKSGMISSLFFVHPAKNPLYSVKVMDWSLRWWKWKLLPDSHYLYGNPDTVFSELIWNWKGSPWQFQSDLRYYSEQIKNNTHYFDTLKKELWEQSKIPIKELNNSRDYVIHTIWLPWNWVKSVATVMQSHIPNISAWD